MSPRPPIRLDPRSPTFADDLAATVGEAMRRAAEDALPDQPVNMADFEMDAEGLQAWTGYYDNEL